jgi:hypothetical protein
MGFVVNKAALGQVFSEYFGFPLPIITPISLSSQSPGAGTIGLLVAAVPSGPNWTPPPPPNYTNLKKKFLLFKRSCEIDILRPIRYWRLNI